MTLSYWQGVFQRQLIDMRKDQERLSSHQSVRLDDIAKNIHNLGTHIVGTGSEPPAKSFKPADIESLQSQMSQLSIARADVAKEHTILRTLSFESQPMRHFSIPEAHRRTFGWVFQELRDQHDKSGMGNLLDWLRKGDGFFLVSG